MTHARLKITKQDKKAKSRYKGVWGSAHTRLKNRVRKRESKRQRGKEAWGLIHTHLKITKQDKKKIKQVAKGSRSTRTRLKIAKNRVIKR